MGATIYYLNREAKGDRFQKSKSVTQQINREEILFQRFADKIDDVIIEAIFSHGLSAPEIAALLAHRLGHFVLAMPVLPGAKAIDRDGLLDYLTLLIHDPDSRLPER